MTTGCKNCLQGDGFSVPFSMAFQPISNITTGEVFAHEALVRGLAGEGAGTVLSAVNRDNRYSFDQQCRVKAIELAARLYPAGTSTNLSINFMPNAVYEPRACIRLTLATAEKVGFPLDRIIFEFTENEKLDTDHVLGICRAYKQMGFKTAIDDFGAGYAGLTLLAKFQPDLVKIDMDLIRGIDQDTAKQVIVRNTVRMLGELGVTPICEGIETAGEYAVMRDLGINLLQGYYLAKPAFEALAEPVFDKAA